MDSSASRSSAATGKSTVNTRRKILRAAGRAFARSGYQVSLDEIAEEAGVGRRTLYNQFKNKDELFSEAIQALINETMLPVFSEADSGDPQKKLSRFLAKYVDVVLQAEYIQTYRLFASEIHKHEHLGEVIFDLGFGNVQAHLADILKAEIAAGRLRKLDAAAAAARILSASVGSSRHRALLGLPTEAPAQRKALIKLVVDEFLRANAP